MPKYDSLNFTVPLSWASTPLEHWGSQVERRRRENRGAVGGEGEVWSVPSQKIYEFFISKWCDMVHSGCVVFKIHVSQKYRWRETNKTLVKILRGRRHRTTPACQILGGHDPCNPCGVDAYDPSPYGWIRAPLNTCFLEPHQSTPRSVELCATDLRLFYWSYALSIWSGFYVTAGRSSVCPSVCPIDRQQQRRVCCGAPCWQEISIASCGCRAEGAGAQQQMRVALCRKPTEEAQHRLVLSADSYNYKRLLFGLRPAASMNRFRRYVIISGLRSSFTCYPVY